jgi:hypothetical protein
MNGFKRAYNIYNSVALYKFGLPIISNKNMISEEKALNKTNWHSIHETKIKNYDWLLDFDAKNLKDLPKIAKDVYRICKKMRYEGYNPRVIYSGFGFQITIPYNDFLENLGEHNFITSDKNNIYQVLQDNSKILYDEYTETIDLNVFDSLRIQKTPNCLVINTEKSKDIYITKILEDQQLKNFKITMVKYK